ncbi:hypothetical protein MW887_008000 [Aspergillus wentii]|nr:hypothetical protein MW887_008000 [Aspergillus wentii]
MRSSLLSLLSLLPLALGADPRSCTGKTKLSPSDFTLQESTDNQYLPSLDKIFENKNTTITHVLATANRSLKKGKPSVGNGDPAEAWAWNSGDDSTPKWTPQGISSSADALGKGEWNGREVWMVSWHNEKDTNVRISFVDRETHEYRHVLLVEPTAKDDFEAVAVHAGGITWYGDQLFVVDTKHGLRVFDLGRIWKVGKGEKIGKDGDGYSAGGYRYVVPQIRSYKWTPGSDSPFRFSWVSLDRSDSPDTLLIGEFVRKDSDPIRLVKWPLNADTRKLQTNDKGIASANFAHCVDFLRVQGGFSTDNTFYLSRSNGKAPKTGDLFKWKPGEKSELKEGWFMAGNEDLSYNPVKKEWYTITEYQDDRFILTYKM